MTGSLSVCILFGLIPIHSDGLFITTYLHDLTKKNSILLVNLLKILVLRHKGQYDLEGSIL